MAKQQWEANWQRHEGARWQSETFETQAEAKDAAEFAKTMRFWNANWQAQTRGETSPAWTMRDGQPK